MKSTILRGPTLSVRVKIIYVSFLNGVKNPAKKVLPFLLVATVFVERYLSLCLPVSTPLFPS